MTSGPKGARQGRDRRALLSDEDHALWQHMASTLDPVRRAKPRVHAGLEAGELTAVRPRLRHEARVVGPEPVSGARPAEPVAHQPLARAVPPLAEIERKTARRIRSGRTEIEARIDLHGMRQGEAHSALRAFLNACYAQDKRWVLVITGKGSPLRGSGGDRNGWSLEGEVERDRGILRRNVPRWLAEPDLRALVVSFSEASVRHGGEGALYVQVRSRSRRSHLD